MSKIISYSPVQFFGSSIFISKGLNIEISNKLPSVYLDEYKKQNPQIVENLSTHFINDKAMQYMKNNNFSGFIKERTEVIMNEIEKKAHITKSTINEADLIEDNIESEEFIEEN